MPLQGPSHAAALTALGPSRPGPGEGDREGVAAVGLALTASFLLRDLPHTWVQTLPGMGTGMLGRVLCRCWALLGR